MPQEQSRDLPLSLLPDVENILTFRPRSGRVIIKPAPELELKSKGGVILADSAVEKRRALGLSLGEVISVADKNIVETTVGQTVYFGWAMGEGQIRSGEQIYLIFQEYNLVAHLDEPTLSATSTGELVENLDTNQK